MTSSHIARGLTDAQRRAVTTLDDRFSYWPVGIARSTIKKLVERGFLVRVPPASGFNMVMHHWSPLGIAVQTYLKDHQK